MVCELYLNKVVKKIEMLTQGRWKLELFRLDQSRPGLPAPSPWSIWGLIAPHFTSKETETRRRKVGSHSQMKTEPGPESCLLTPGLLFFLPSPVTF